jgi:hypothetical protein
MMLAGFVISFRLLLKHLTRKMATEDRHSSGTSQMTLESHWIVALP